VDLGIDLVSDGQISKISHATYIADRFTGFAGDPPREAGQDLVHFPNLLRKPADRGATAKYRRQRCVGGNHRARYRPAGTGPAQFEGRG
jgi:5-methyltetrahydropteroyltriglutamate--homocysteine methyltransferase